jgi:carboxymethylenebutenolidase
VVLPHVVVIGFDEASRVAYEHIYWDQATLLVQVGRLDAALLPVAAAEKAKRPTHPANEMIHRSPLTQDNSLRKISPAKTLIGRPVYM